jgi:hypothetical protein
VHIVEPAKLQPLGIALTFQFSRPADPPLCDQIRARFARFCPPTTGLPLLFRNFFAWTSRMASVLSAPDFTDITMSACPICGGEFAEPLARLRYWQRSHGVHADAAFGPSDRTSSRKCRACGVVVRADALGEHLDRQFKITLYFAQFDVVFATTAAMAAKGQNKFVWKPPSADDTARQRPFVIAEHDDRSMPHFWEMLEAADAALEGPMTSGSTSAHSG